MANEGMCFQPWTQDEVRSINAYQLSGAMHPFTCINRSSPDHLGTEGILIADKDGMYCPFCESKQDWVHDFMANWSWKQKVMSIVALRNHDKP